MTNRRSFLKKSVAAGATLGLASCAPQALRLAEKQLNIQYSSRYLPKLRISLDRVVKETVGLRPYRTLGPRIEKEELGSKTLVHNYGHGGSGWSLSWGSAALAADLVDTSWGKEVSLATTSFNPSSPPPKSSQRVAVIGCGVIGLTTARTLQRRGYQVTIYTKEMAPNITSSKATGTWSPTHRLIDSNQITDSFRERFKQMHQTSFLTYQNLLGLGDLVVWNDAYDLRQQQRAPDNIRTSSQDDFMKVLPQPERIPPKEHPFQASLVYRRTSMVFNIPSLLKMYTDDFLRFGGTVKVQEFKRKEDVEALPENCVVNCTGIGAKKLMGDPNLTPISGQLAFVIPQKEVNYRIVTDGAYTINRKDGIVIGGTHKMGDWNTTPSREDTEQMVLAIKEAADAMYT